MYTWYEDGEVYIKWVLEGADVTEEDQKTDAESDKEDTEEAVEEDTEEDTEYEHICDDSGCTNEGTHRVETWDGSVVYYCDYHYQMIEDAADKLESESYHKCEASGCNNEGTYSIEGFNGTEYYCYYHYKEMADAVEKIMGN